jgi:hypothetical protein
VHAVSFLPNPTPAACSRRPAPPAQPCPTHRLLLALPCSRRPLPAPPCSLALPRRARPASTAPSATATTLPCMGLVAPCVGRYPPYVGLIAPCDERRFPSMQHHPQPSSSASTSSSPSAFAALIRDIALESD